MAAVLVLEDNPAVGTTLCTMLTLAGFTTHHAKTVDEALLILATERVDAVSLDVCVPDPKGLNRSGLSLLATLRTMPPYATLPAVVFTGMPLSAQQEGAARKLHAAVFYKPQSYSVLIKHLARELSLRAARSRRSAANTAPSTPPS